MQAHGDHNLHYIHGPDLFGPEFAPRIPDGVHPDAEGYQLLGRRFVDGVMPKLLAARS